MFNHYAVKVFDMGKLIFLEIMSTKVIDVK